MSISYYERRKQHFPFSLFRLFIISFLKQLYICISNLLGQGSLWQDWVSVDDPTQSLPPCWGAGFVHVLDLVWLPSPHETEQWLYDPKADHPPSTRLNKHLEWSMIKTLKHINQDEKCEQNYCILRHNRNHTV